MEIDLNLLIERQLEYWGKSYNNFCTIADDIMERYNPCQFVNGICRLGIEDGCCSNKIMWFKKLDPFFRSLILLIPFASENDLLNGPGVTCEYHTKFGCSIKSLTCKLYFCGVFPQTKKFKTEINELRQLVRKTLPPFNLLRLNEGEVLTIWRKILKIYVNDWNSEGLKKMHLIAEIWKR